MIADTYLIGDPLVGIKTPIKCSRECLSTLDCMSFFYSKAAQTCRLHSVVFLSTNAADIKGEGGYKYYVVTNEQCPGQYGYVLDKQLNWCFALIPRLGGHTRAIMEAKCNAANGGKMMIVDTLQKHQIVSKVADTYPSLRFVAIGLFKQGGGWEWTDGSPLVWAKWNPPKEPTGGAHEDCGYITKWMSNNWNDSPCTQTRDTLIGCEL